MLEEQLAVITGLWASTGDFSFEGEHYTVTDSPGLPKPAQDKPPILIGGSGKKRTPALAARYADEFNLPFVPFERAWRRTTGSGGPARRSAATRARCGSPARWCSASAPTRPRYAAGRTRSATTSTTLRRDHLGGTVDEVVDKIGRYAESGQTRLYLQTLDLQDLDHLRLVAAEVMPRVSGR